MTKYVSYLAVVLCVVPGVIACAPHATKMTHVRLPMGYVANVQFAPWYVAVERGYFAEEGIEVEFDYGWETDGIRLVGAGELPFALAGGDQVLLARAQGLPVLTVASWYGRFPVGVVALADSGIRQPTDLVGRKVGIPEMFGASYIGWRALAAASGLKDDDVQLEVIGYTQVANLVEGRVDAAVVYASNEPVQLEQQGYQVTFISVADYAPLVSNGVVANEKTLQEKPELVRGFLRAFLHGLTDAAHDPDAAFEICRRYVEGLEKNEATQKAVLRASIPYWQTDPPGWSDPRAWQVTERTMREAGLLSSPVEVNGAFTNDYLP